MSIALLSRRPDGGEGCALWHQPVAVMAATRTPEVASVLAQVERHTREGCHVLGFVTYEAGKAFDSHFAIKSGDTGLPFAWFAAFKEYQLYKNQPGAEYDQSAWYPDQLPATYARQIDTMKEHIAAGDTYQVNYTFRLHAARPPLMKRLFMRLYEAQPTPYAMYIETPEFRVASVSPELFFRREGGSIICEPMKGTCRRGPHPVLDREAGETLRQSSKNRAENVMIVDMIRNDLGRIAASGSIDVTDMFKVTPWPTLWQMTTTVSARTKASLTEIFAALFPSASITGAPKLKTSEIIAATEDSPRGLYTGAIGWCGPDGRSEFAVAIRTAVQTNQPAQTIYGVGSGIVWDSQADDEYRECRLKGHILEREPASSFQMIETLRWSPASGFAFLDGHLARLQSSAIFLNRACDITSARDVLSTHVASLPRQDHRIRLVVDRAGQMHVEHTLLHDAPEYENPDGAPEITAVIDCERTAVDSIYLFHKTTRREVYDEARARFPDYQEVLLVNERDELMEFTHGNVVIRRGDEWMTPPLACGLLPGVFRQSLIDRRMIREQIVRVDELRPEDRVYFINSVRGWRRVKL